MYGTVQVGATRWHRGIGRLTDAAQAGIELLLQAGKRNGNLRTFPMALLRLLDRFGSGEMQEALGRDESHPNRMRLVWLHRREELQRPQLATTMLSGYAQTCDLAEPAHRLDSRSSSNQMETIGRVTQHV